MKTVEEAALERYPINQWGIHTTIADRNLNRLMRESYVQGWNDRESFVAAEREELVKNITSLLEEFSSGDGLYDHGAEHALLKVLEILTPEK